MQSPRTVTLRGDAVARGTRVMAAGKGAVSQRKSEGELCTRVGDMTSALGTSTAGGNTVTLPVTTCVDGLFRTVGTATGSGHVAEPTGGECERDSGDCCRLGTDTILCGEHVTDPPEGEGAGSQATTVLGDPLGRVPKEIAGDMVPEVGCGMFRNFPLPQGEGGIEFTGDRTFPESHMVRTAALRHRGWQPRQPNQRAPHTERQEKFLALSRRCSHFCCSSVAGAAAATAAVSARHRVMFPRLWWHSNLTR